jgi:hypothetical protein
LNSKLAKLAIVEGEEESHFLPAGRLTKFLEELNQIVAMVVSSKIREPLIRLRQFQQRT